MSRAERLKWDRIYASPDPVRGRDPSPFVVDAVRSVAPGRALVVAMGEGRHAVFLAQAGFRVEGIDVSFPAVRKAMARARRDGSALSGMVADLDDFPLPAERYDLVCVVSFLHRSCFDAIARAVRPGGALVWETFTRAHAAFGSPRSPAYLLDPGELRTRFADLDLRRYRETVLEHDGERRAVASLFAIRPALGP